jgi:hypothetical protein
MNKAAIIRNYLQFCNHSHLPHCPSRERQLGTPIGVSRGTGRVNHASRRQ